VAVGARENKHCGLRHVKHTVDLKIPGAM